MVDARADHLLYLHVIDEYPLFPLLNRCCLLARVEDKSQLNSMTLVCTFYLSNLHLNLMAPYLVSFCVNHPNLGGFQVRPRDSFSVTCMTVVCKRRRVIPSYPTVRPQFVKVYLILPACQCSASASCQWRWRLLLLLLVVVVVVVGVGGCWRLLEVVGWCWVLVLVLVLVLLLFSVKRALS